MDQQIQRWRAVLMPSQYNSIALAKPSIDTKSNRIVFVNPAIDAKTNVQNHPCFTICDKTFSITSNTIQTCATQFEIKLKDMINELHARASHNDSIVNEGKGEIPPLLGVDGYKLIAWNAYKTTFISTYFDKSFDEIFLPINRDVLYHLFRQHYNNHGIVIQNCWCGNGHNVIIRYEQVHRVCKILWMNESDPIPINEISKQDMFYNSIRSALVSLLQHQKDKSQNGLIYIHSVEFIRLINPINWINERFGDPFKYLQYYFQKSMELTRTPFGIMFCAR